MLNLTDREKEIIKDKVEEGYSYEEIGARLNLKVQSVKNKIQRAILRNKDGCVTYAGITKKVDSIECLYYLIKEWDNTPPQPTLTAQELDKKNMHVGQYKGGLVKGKQLPNGRIYICCICNSKPTTKKNYYCKECYKHWKSEILAGDGWITDCRNEERKQRRHVDPVVDRDIKNGVDNLDKTNKFDTRLEEVRQDFIDDTIDNLAAEREEWIKWENEKREIFAL